MPLTLKLIPANPVRVAAAQLPPARLMYERYSRPRSKNRRTTLRGAGDDIYANLPRLPHGMTLSSASTRPPPTTRADEFHYFRLVNLHGVIHETKQNLVDVERSVDLLIGGDLIHPLVSELTAMLEVSS